MKVIEEGYVRQFRCSGYGNGDRGCGALLEVDHNDLRYFGEQEYPWRIAEEAVLFKCPCCGALTDIDKKYWPQDPVRTLKLYSNAWKYGEEDVSS